MAANPYVGFIQAREAATGKPVTLRFSADDVANNKVTWTDFGASTAFSVPVPSGGYIIDDIITAEDGEDTSRIQLVSGPSNAPVFLQLAILAATTIESATRAQGLKGRVLAPGNTYGFLQLT